jgi:hypothetical protein
MSDEDEVARLEQIAANGMAFGAMLARAHYLRGIADAAKAAQHYRDHCAIPPEPGCLCSEIVCAIKALASTP